MDKATAESADHASPHNPFPQWGYPVRVVEPGMPHVRYGAALQFISLESVEGCGPELIRGRSNIMGLCGMAHRRQFDNAQELWSLPVWSVPKGISGLGRIKRFAFLSQILTCLGEHAPGRLISLGVSPEWYQSGT